MNSNDNLLKFCYKYYCEKCHYGTCKKSSFKDHLLSIKHSKQHVSNVSNYNLLPICYSKYSCEVCNKVYKDYSGLWRHKKKCVVEQNLENKFTTTDKELIMTLIKQNNELQTMIAEVIKNGIHNTSNSHNNSHNKSFNLQFFLNETCKDAMNITDFLDSIKLQLCDLERVGELGYIEGISSIIVKNLKNLDVTQRPFHCTDKKRETIYIKDEDKWEKDEGKKKMHKIVKKIADKNARLLPKFKQAHPDCTKSSSPFSDQYNKIIIESMGGSGDNDYEKEEKIIKKVSKEVTFEKEV
jgi:hypothetical protein